MNNQPFTIRQANEWFCGSGTAPKMLFDQFWFEGELCILFADSNVGKSILAVQIADSLSRGTQIGPFINQMEPCRVLYLDFEHTASQFETRYTSPDGMHQFSPTFFRAELGIDATATESADPHQYIREAIERSVMQTGAQVLVIDNITYLFKQNGSASDAMLLLKHLKALKSKYGLSILALAHTPKRNLGRHITQNDLHGSKMLINFCDSAFAIGRELIDPNTRYLKQIKQRNYNEEYGEDNVAVFRITKPADFLQFEFTGLSSEHELLKKEVDNDWDIARAKAIELAKSGLSQRRIAVRIDVSPSTVCRMLKEEDSEV